MFCVFVFRLIISTSCNEAGKKKEGFYEFSQTWDLYRVPLIDPFQVISADQGNTWTLKRFDKEDVVSKVGINGSVMVVFSRRTALPGKMTQAWFVLRPDTKEEVFTSETEYKSYLTSIGLGSVKLYDINQVFSDFDKYKKLPEEWPKKSH